MNECALQQATRLEQCFSLVATFHGQFDTDNKWCYLNAMVRKSLKQIQTGNFTFIRNANINFDHLDMISGILHPPFDINLSHFMKNFQLHPKIWLSNQSFKLHKYKSIFTVLFPLLCVKPTIRLEELIFGISHNGIHK